MEGMELLDAIDQFLVERLNSTNCFREPGGDAVLHWTRNTGGYVVPGDLARAVSVRARRVADDA